MTAREFREIYGTEVEEAIVGLTSTLLRLDLSMDAWGVYYKDIHRMMKRTEQNRIYIMEKGK